MSITTKTCRLCGNIFKEYDRKHGFRCGSCNTKIRRFRAKAAAIKLLGGKCKKCGWHGNQAAMQFHHINPDEKDFIIGNVGNKSWDSIKKEMQKCVLLCANCHMIEHSTKNTKIFLKEALNYKGRMLKF
jgi:5-methylcytosine-specific restriction endonuclease McrA